MKRIVLYAFALALLAGCSKEMSDNGSAPIKGKSLIYATYEVDSDLTRTIASPDGNNGYNLNWEIGDHIGVFDAEPGDKTNEDFAYTGSEGVFYGDKGYLFGQGYVAYYPYSESHQGISSTGEILVKVPSEQKHRTNAGEAGSFGQNIAPAIAYGKASSDDRLHLTFRPVATYMRVPIVGSGTIKTLQLKIKRGSEYVGLAGEAKVKLSDIIKDVKSVAPNASDYKETSITLTCHKDGKGGVELDENEPKYFWFVIPSGLRLKDETVEIIVNDGVDILTRTLDYASFQTTKVNGAIVMGQGVTTNEEGKSVAVPFEWKVGWGDGVDLSASGTANCYIVSEPGNYLFNCQYQGNSSDPITGNMPVKAEVLWETFNTSTKPEVGDVIANVTYYDGYIYFKTPEVLREGNALIALKSSSDEILWSWHIWVTSADLESLAFEHSVGVIMDRNLGALTDKLGDKRSIGFYYQWGRKDPLWDRIASTNYDRLPRSRGDSRWGVDFTYAIQHPTTFLQGNNYNFDWLIAPLGGAYEDSDETRWGTEKTKYDPCPSGWKVPSNDFFNKMGWGSFEYWDENGLTVMYSAINEIYGYFPAGGLIDYLSGDFDSRSLYDICYWSSTSNKRQPGGMAHAYALIDREDNWWGSNVVEWSKASGMNIRCTRE